MGSIFSTSSANNSISKSASFLITDDIVNKNIQPFTATIPAIGNTLIDTGSGFEPIIFKDKYIAIKDSPNRIYIEKNSLTKFDTFSEALFNGASVFVYRIKNGKMFMVRNDKVKNNGANTSGWRRVISPKNIIPKSSTQYYFTWNDWNRPNTSYYFSVRAIDKYGNLSGPSNSIELKYVGKENNVNPLRNITVPFKPRRRFFSEPVTPSSPTNLKGLLHKSGYLELHWDPVSSPDIAGYVIYRSDFPPKMHKGYYLELSNSPNSKDERIHKGDMIILSKKLYSPSRNRFMSKRAWGAHKEFSNIAPGLITFFPDENPVKSWKFVPHTTNSPVEMAGETFLEINLKGNNNCKLRIYNHSGTSQNWYDVLEKRVYKMEVWLKQTGNGSVKFKISSKYTKFDNNSNTISLKVGSVWKKHTVEFTPTVIQTDSRPHSMTLEFSGPSVFSIDNFRIYRADTPYLDILPREMNELKKANLSFLRTHGLIKTGRKTYNLDQLTNSRGVISGTLKSNTLPQLLNIIRDSGTNPWLQIELHLSPNEWLGLIEYLAAPFNPDIDTKDDKPWAYKRFMQGQRTPWTDEFKKINIELSNETWNSLFRPWNFDSMTDEATNKKYNPAEVYGKYQEYVISIMKNSPYWLEGFNDKFNFVIGGHAANKYYLLNAAKNSKSSKLLTIASYNGGWDENESIVSLNKTSFFNLLSYVNQISIPRAKDYMHELSKIKKQHSNDVYMGTYEAGPGYVLNGLNKARVSKEQAKEQEYVNKSLAAGTATLDSFLSRIYNGFISENFFTFAYGSLWKSHAEWYHGGHAYPSWKLLSLFNNHALGDMLLTKTISSPTTDLKALSGRRAVKDAPLVAVYSTRKGSRYNIFIISRKMPFYPSNNDDGFTPVSIKLPFDSAKSVTLYRMTGSPYDNNVYDNIVKVEKLNIDGKINNNTFVVDDTTGADNRGLPPASTFLYVFEAVEKNK